MMEFKSRHFDHAAILAPDFNKKYVDFFYSKILSYLGSIRFYNRPIQDEEYKQSY